MYRMGMKVVSIGKTRFRVLITDLKAAKGRTKSRTLSLEDSKGASIDSLKAMIEHCFAHAEFRDFPSRKKSGRRI